MLGTDYLKRFQTDRGIIMAKLYRMFFRTVEKEYNPERRFAKKKTKTGPDLKVILSPTDGSITILEDEIKKYWDYGDGVERLEYAGEINDDLLKPSIMEPDFVDEQIKSRKSGELIGYQG